MKFAVTGGAGFIGSYLVKHLVKMGHEVIVIDNLYRGKLENLREVSNRIDFRNFDILDYKELEHVCTNLDGIFHEAALTYVTESFTQREKYHQVNVGGTENVFKLAKNFGLKVVYASSSSVYGNTHTIPILEDSERKPINPYGETKLQAEYTAEKYSKLGTKIIGLRYMNVYGKGQISEYAGVISKFIERITNDKPPIIFGDGSQVRDFISVEDVAEANLAAMESTIDNSFINIGTGIATAILQLANTMIELSGKPLKPIFDSLPEGDVKASQADVTLAKNLISWESKTTLKNGLRKFFFS